MEKSQEYRNVDMSGAARGVWLVKVPKYLSEKWKKNPGSDVGKLRISKPRFAGGKPEVMFSLSDQIAQKDPDDAVPVPRDHKFVLTGMANQSLGLLSQEKNDMDMETAEQIPGRLAIEGRVIQRAECRPIGDSNYMMLKKKDLEEKNKPVKQVVQLDKAVINYKPKSYQVGDRSKKEAVKKYRTDKSKVLDLLFNAFEKHQYYNVKDLVRLTQQPIPYLKEILNEVCVYNMRAPHKNMWELKPEFRHYRGGESSAGT